MENFDIHGNLTVMPKESDYALLISKDTATDMCMISTNTSGLYLNPVGDVWIPYQKQLILGEVSGFTRLGFNTGNTQNTITSSNKDLRITTYKNLEIKATNTLFPAQNSITYLLSSNAARYHALRAVYGTGTGSSNYIQVYHNGVSGQIITGTDGLTLNPFSGNVTIGAVGKPACIQIRDSDDGNWTKCTTLAGGMTCVAGAC